GSNSPRIFRRHRGGRRQPPGRYSSRNPKGALGDEVRRRCSRQNASQHFSQAIRTLTWRTHSCVRHDRWSMRNRLPVGILFLFLFLFPTRLVGFGEYWTGRLVPFAWVSVAAQAIRTELAELNGRQERDLLSACADCHLKLDHS